MAPLPPGLAKSLEETKVDYHRVGKSGLRVSVPIVGCMSIGNPEWAPWVLGPDKALPLLKAAWDRGVNTVCTSRAYVGGLRLTLRRVVGYRQYLLQWRLGEGYREGDQGVQHPAPQASSDVEGV